MSSVIAVSAPELIMRGLSSTHNVNYLFEKENGAAKVAFRHPACGYVTISFVKNDNNFMFRWVWRHDDLKAGRRLTAYGDKATSGVLTEIVNEFYTLINSIFKMNTGVLEDCGHAFDWTQRLGASKVNEIMNLQAAHYPIFTGKEAINNKLPE